MQHIKTSSENQKEEKNFKNLYEENNYYLKSNIQFMMQFCSSFAFDIDNGEALGLEYEKIKCIFNLQRNNNLLCVFDKDNKIQLILSRQDYHNKVYSSTNYFTEGEMDKYEAIIYNPALDIKIGYDELNNLYSLSFVMTMSDYDKGRKWNKKSVSPLKGVDLKNMPYVNDDQKLKSEVANLFNEMLIFDVIDRRLKNSDFFGCKDKNDFFRQNDLLLLSNVYCDKSEFGQDCPAFIMNSVYGIIKQEILNKVELIEENFKDNNQIEVDLDNDFNNNFQSDRYDPDHYPDNNNIAKNESNVDFSFNINREQNEKNIHNEFKNYEDINLSEPEFDSNTIHEISVGCSSPINSILNSELKSFFEFSNVNSAINTTKKKSEVKSEIRNDNFIQEIKSQSPMNEINNTSNILQNKNVTFKRIKENNNINNDNIFNNINNSKIIDNSKNIHNDSNISQQNLPNNNLNDIKRFLKYENSLFPTSPQNIKFENITNSEINQNNIDSSKTSNNPLQNLKITPKNDSSINKENSLIKIKNEINKFEMNKTKIETFFAFRTLLKNQGKI